MSLTDFAFFALLFIVVVAFIGGLNFRKKHGHRLKRRRVEESGHHHHHHEKHYHEIR